MYGQLVDNSTVMNGSSNKMVRVIYHHFNHSILINWYQIFSKPQHHSWWFIN